MDLEKLKELGTLRRVQGEGIGQRMDVLRGEPQPSIEGQVDRLIGRAGSVGCVEGGDVVDNACSRCGG